MKVCLHQLIHHPINHVHRQAVRVVMWQSTALRRTAPAYRRIKTEFLPPGLTRLVQTVCARRRIKVVDNTPRSIAHQSTQATRNPRFRFNDIEIGSDRSKLRQRTVCQKRDARSTVMHTNGSECAEGLDKSADPARTNDKDGIAVIGFGWFLFQDLYRVVGSR